MGGGDGSRRLPAAPGRRGLGEDRPKIRLMLVDDHVMFREGLRQILEASGLISVVAMAGDGREALDLAAQQRPDVAVLETVLPMLNGLEVTRLLKRDVPGCKAILLSGSNGVDFAPQALRAGAVGVVLKRAEAAELLLAIRTVARGDTYFSSSISGSILTAYVQMMEQAEQDHGLTGREREVLQMIAEGFGNQEIAQHCFISVKTVEAHKANMMKKLSLTSRNELLMYAVRQGLARAG